MVRCKKPGFTLIELLVVISIIALLVSILLPALAAARESARSVECLSNQRQLLIVTATYHTDHKDSYFPFWENYLTGDSNATQWTGKLYWVGYVPTVEMYKCPSVPAGAINWSNPPDGRVRNSFWSNTHYGYNHRYLGSSVMIDGTWTNSLPAKTMDLEDPSNTIAFVDSIDWTNPGRGQYIVEDRLDLGGLRQAYPRHDGPSISVGWADGHATRLLTQDEHDAYTHGLGDRNTPRSYWTREKR